MEVYQTLEPLLNDYRRIRLRRPDGSFELSYIDDPVDQMLTRDSLFNISPPRLPDRTVLESTGQFPGPRASSMQAEFDAKAGDFEKEARESLSRMYDFMTTKKRREKWKLSPPRKKKSGLSSSLVREDGEIDDGGGGSTHHDTCRQDKESMSTDKLPHITTLSSPSAFPKGAITECT